jgi:hypothetical protein
MALRAYDAKILRRQRTELRDFRIANVAFGNGRRVLLAILMTLPALHSGQHGFGLRCPAP